VAFGDDFIAEQAKARADAVDRVGLAKRYRLSQLSEVKTAVEAFGKKFAEVLRAADFTPEVIINAEKLFDWKIITEGWDLPGLGWLDVDGAWWIETTRKTDQPTLDYVAQGLIPRGARWRVSAKTPHRRAITTDGWLIADDGSLYFHTISYDPRAHEWRPAEEEGERVLRVFSVRRSVGYLAEDCVEDGCLDKAIDLSGFVDDA